MLGPITAAKLLVMGCCGHSLMREWLLGGASRTALGGRILPVWMASPEPACQAAASRESGRDCHLEDAVPLVAEQFVGLFDVVELEPVRDHRAQVHAAGLNHRHQAPHAFLAAGA